MTATLALTEALWQEILQTLELGVETAGVVLAGEARVGADRALLGRRILWAPEDAYDLRERKRLAIASRGYVPALKQAAEDGSLAIFLHTHPGGGAVPSHLDHGVDAQLREPFELRTGREYVSLIVGGTPQRPCFTGRLHAAGQPLERLRVVGGRLGLFGAQDSALSSFEPASFDRQIRAFGTHGQDLLAALRVGVVGAGGTGSAVCEQLSRLGVGSVVMIDDDEVSETNLTRIHESAQADVGHAKVQVAARAAERIGLGTASQPSIGRVTQLELARLLCACDVVFGCTDDNRGRAILSRLAYWYLLAVIDCGFLIDTDESRIRGLYGRVSTVYPGAGCLLCRGAIDPAMLGAEALAPAERERLAGEGYVPGLGEPDPSVGTYTTLIASFAVNELLARLFGYGGEHPPTELLLRLHDRYLSNRSPAAKDGHYCADRATWGRGDQEPFLDQLWS